LFETSASAISSFEPEVFVRQKYRVGRRTLVASKFNSSGVIHAAAGRVTFCDQLALYLLDVVGFRNRAGANGRIEEDSQRQGGMEYFAWTLE
jgi:hypothetical protein